MLQRNSIAPLSLGGVHALIALVRQRIGDLGEDLGAVLLVVALAARPTTDLVATATKRPVDDIVVLLEPVEAQGIIDIDGHHIRFTHPLLAAGVAANATPAQRRAAHRSLAAAVAQPELQARHLALGSAAGEPYTLNALDTAAAVTRVRGAPATAAELVDLAIRLGGDTALRRLLSANHHFAAGDAARARTVLEPVIGNLPPGPVRSMALTLMAGICVYTQCFDEAERHLVDGAAGNAAMAVQVHLLLAFTQINTGRLDEAVASIAVAREKADQLGSDGVMSQVLSMAVMLGVIRGDGIDLLSRRRALELEDPALQAPTVFRASANEAQLRAWAGDLDGAHMLIRRVWQTSADGGAESELLFLATQAVLIAIRRADMAEATELAAERVERAEQLGGDNSQLIAMTVQTAVAAYAGRVAEARQAGAVALAAAEATGAHRVGEWPTMLLGFLEVSQGRYSEALEIIGPLISKFRANPASAEILTASFIPDGIDALVALGRLAEAGALIEAMETNGARLDRPWTLAIGARGRAMWLAAKGDLSHAEDAVLRAMDEHDRLPMPFERARTQLLLGQIQRRRRHRKAAEAALTEALAAFNRIGTLLWSQRAHAELGSASGHEFALTPAEHRAAERAASGMSNKEIAAELFVAPKTVEMNLSSAYRKLGIRSRTQLANRLKSP